MKVEEALEDPDWINAMHEELHNFERIKFGHWLRSPTTTIISSVPNGYFATSKMKMEKFTTNHVSSPKATLKSKVWTMVRHMPPLLD